MGIFDIFKKKESQKPDLDRRSLDSATIDAAQMQPASPGYVEILRLRYFSGYPEMPFISLDREQNTAWIHQVESFPDMIIKPEKMVRYSDGLLPGHVYMLYWLSRNKGKRIPAYFEYEYGICFVAEKAFLFEKGYINDEDMLTMKGLNAITEHSEVIDERKGKTRNVTAVPVQPGRDMENEFYESVDNNLNGIELEKQGKESKAIELYKKNVAKRFDGNHPYDRLAIYYRKNKDYDNEIKVLETAIDVFTHDVPKERKDRMPKLEKFKARLKRAKELKAKNNK